MTEQLSLIPEKLFSPKDRKVVLEDLPTDLLGPDPDPEFIASVRNVGVLQSIGLLEKDGGYIVGWGRRRIKAARIVGMISISAKIFPQGSISPAILTLIENRHRSDNLPAQLDAIATLRLTATPEEICVAVGMTPQELAQAIRLLDGLVPELRDAMRDGRIKATTAKQAAKLPIEQQQALAQQDIIKSKDVAQYFQATEKPEPETEALFVPEPQTETVQSVAPHEKVSRQSWKLQAKPLIEQLLQIVPEGEDVREYLDLVADALKKKA